jgi:hypothetical protein
LRDIERPRDIGLCLALAKPLNSFLPLVTMAVKREAHARHPLRPHRSPAGRSTFSTSRR